MRRLNSPKRTVLFCGPLNKNDPHRLLYLNAWLLGSGSIRKCVLVGVGVALLKEVFYWAIWGFRCSSQAQCLSPPDAYWWGCGAFSYFSRTTSACMLPCFPSWWLIIDKPLNHKPAPNETCYFIRVAGVMMLFTATGHWLGHYYSQKKKSYSFYSDMGIF